MGLELRVAAEILFNLPLEKVSSDRSSLIEKLVASVAIAVFTACSGGYYGVYTYRFFAARRFENQFQNLKLFVDAMNYTSNDGERIQKVFSDIKTKYGPAGFAHMINGKDINGKGHSERSLLFGTLKAANYVMAEELIKNGANLNAKGRLGNVLETLLIDPNVTNRLKTIHFLVETHGIDVNGGEKDERGCEHILHIAMWRAYGRTLECSGEQQRSKEQQELLEVIHYLIQKGATLESKRYTHSFLYNFAERWDDHPALVGQIVTAMLERGVTLRDGELDTLCEAAQQHIRSWVKPSGM